MKYNVKIGEKNFEVEIDDINKRPIVARVAGVEFEVSPENGITARVSEPVAQTDASKPVAAALPTSVNLSGNVMLAPLPGTVVEVFVKPGDAVEAGQVILVIEAMKMKNSIRSVRDGKIATVHVSAGQTVMHKQALVEFSA